MDDFNWYLGTQLISENPEILTPVTPETVVEKIRTDEALKEQVEALSRAKLIDTRAYRKMKTGLPYVITGKFRDNIRHSERFESTQFWIIDLDHCLTTPAVSRKLKDRIKEDPHTLLMFVSPGGEGLKVFFQLNEPCTDPVAYSQAYRNFAAWYADYLELEGIVDLKTSDVARACFLSHDPDAYYCPFPQLLEWRKYLPPVPAEPEVPEVKAAAVVDQQVISQIRQIMNPQKVVRQKEKQIFQPEQIREIEKVLVDAVAQLGIRVESIMPLNYGLKLRVSRQLQSGEVNVFYGKKGFSVVMSPRSGTSPELNQLLYETVAHILIN